MSVHRFPLPGARSLPVRSTTLLLVALATANAVVWLWAIALFRQMPLMLGTSLLAYSLGLRHALDADHIAAIDNVTRKLTHEQKRPIAAGLYFSLGHSTVVVVASIAIAVTATAFRSRFAAFRDIGSLVGTAVSSLFLVAVATMNAAVLAQVFRAFQRLRHGLPCAEHELHVHLLGGGVLSRLVRPLFNLIRKSWHMYPLGLLFGLGFDTASEVALLGLSASHAASGLSLVSILVFPALFTAGMCLVDTADSVVMTNAYAWAVSRPMRKLYYNLTITFVSIVVAVFVASVQVLGIVGARFALPGHFWSAVHTLSGNLGLLGIMIVGAFALIWIVSAAIYYFNDFDSVGVREQSVEG